MIHARCHRNRGRSVNLFLSRGVSSCSVSFCFSCTSVIINGKHNGMLYYCWHCLILFLFEMVHTFSHAVHLQESPLLQMRLIHMVVYVFLGVLYVLFYRQHRAPPIVNVSLAIVWMIDMVLFLKGVPFIWYFSTSMLLFILLVAGAWPFFTPLLRRKCLVFACLFFMLLALFYNDMVNCRRMLEYKALTPLSWFSRTIFCHCLLESVRCIV